MHTYTRTNKQTCYLICRFGMGDTYLGKTGKAIKESKTKCLRFWMGKRSKVLDMHSSRIGGDEVCSLFEYLDGGTDRRRFVSYTHKVTIDHPQFEYG